jgi:hypothetical protein
LKLIEAPVADLHIIGKSLKPRHSGWNRVNTPAFLSFIRELSAADRPAKCSRYSAQGWDLLLMERGDDSLLKPFAPPEHLTTDDLTSLEWGCLLRSAPKEGTHLLCWKRSEWILALIFIAPTKFHVIVGRRCSQCRF